MSADRVDARVSDEFAEARPDALPRTSSGTALFALAVAVRVVDALLLVAGGYLVVATASFGAAG